jgi:hypothetical protein
LDSKQRLCFEPKPGSAIPPAAIAGAVLWKSVGFIVGNEARIASNAGTDEICSMASQKLREHLGGQLFKPIEHAILNDTTKMRKFEGILL